MLHGLVQLPQLSHCLKNSRSKTKQQLNTLSLKVSNTYAVLLFFTSFGHLVGKGAKLLSRLGQCLFVNLGTIIN